MNQGYPDCTDGTSEGGSPAKNRAWRFFPNISLELPKPGSFFASRRGKGC